MGFFEAIKSAVNENYVTFSGRARRSEFWYFLLFLFVVSFALSFIDMALGFDEIGVLSLLFSVLMILPSMAVAVRRLHDQDKSGWWYLTFLIPVVGTILLIVFGCTRGTAGPNRFGEDPKGVSVENVF